MTIDRTTSSRNVVGTVISNKMDKTIVIQIERKVKHPLYGKYVRRYSKMYAHDQENICNVGDIVKIQQCRPISKTKSWKLLEVLDQTEKK